MNSGQAQVGRGPGPRVTAVNLIACVAISIESLTPSFHPAFDRCQLAARFE